MAIIRREELMAFRAHLDEAIRFRAAAAAERRSFSEWARKALSKEARRVLAGYDTKSELPEAKQAL